MTLVKFPLRGCLLNTFSACVLSAIFVVFLCLKQGDPGVRGPMGNPGKEGPKVRKYQAHIYTFSNVIVCVELNELCSFSARIYKANSLILWYCLLKCVFNLVYRDLHWETLFINCLLDYLWKPYQLFYNSYYSVQSYVLAAEVVAMDTVLYRCETGKAISSRILWEGKKHFEVYTHQPLVLGLFMLAEKKKHSLSPLSLLQGVKGERGFPGPTGDKGDEVSEKSLI